MTWGPADKLDRTAKILIDSGKANDPADAAAYLKNLVLQVAAGPEIEAHQAAQAALATAVNVGRRAFKGGVHVHLQTDPGLDTGWCARRTASEVVRAYGSRVVDRLDEQLPTLVIGGPRNPIGKPLLYCTWQGWAGGVVQTPEAVFSDRGIVPAGVLAAALGVCETFQQALGYVVAGRRDVGISLWRPDVDWRSAEAGPALQYLPSALWLLGLGHLGQAYAWTIGMLPYAQPRDVDVGLVDFDVAVDGNIATQLLVEDGDVGKPKARIVATAMEGLGFQTRIVERAFDEHFRAGRHAHRRLNEPTTALAGFDDVTPRRSLGKAGFERIVDAGLGHGPIEYLDMVLHTFPAAGDPAFAFPDEPPRSSRLGDAYEQEIIRQVEAGSDETAARCGMLDIAGVTVGAAFVGAIASTLGVADILRLLHDGQGYSVVSLDLRSPNGVQAIPGPDESLPPPYTAAT